MQGGDSDQRLEREADRSRARGRWFGVGAVVPTWRTATKTEVGMRCIPEAPARSTSNAATGRG
jgi:hypothetical protein